MIALRSPWRDSESGNSEDGHGLTSCELWRSTMVCGVAAGASPSTSNPVVRSGRLRRDKRTKRDLFERTGPTRPSFTTRRTSLGGVSSDLLQSSRAEWEATVSWVWLCLTGGLRASSSTGIGGGRE